MKYPFEEKIARVHVHSVDNRLWRPLVERIPDVRKPTHSIVKVWAHDRKRRHLHPADILLAAAVDGLVQLITFSALIGRKPLAQGHPVGVHKIHVAFTQHVLDFGGLQGLIDHALQRAVINLDKEAVPRDAESSMVVRPRLLGSDRVGRPCLEAGAKLVPRGAVQRGSVLDKGPLQTIGCLGCVGFGDDLAGTLVDDLFEAVPGFVVAVGAAVDDPAPFVVLQCTEAVLDVLCWRR